MSVWFWRAMFAIATGIIARRYFKCDLRHACGLSIPKSKKFSHPLKSWQLARGQESRPSGRLFCFEPISPAGGDPACVVPVRPNGGRFHPAERRWCRVLT